MAQNMVGIHPEQIFAATINPGNSTRIKITIERGSKMAYNARRIKIGWENR